MKCLNWNVRRMGAREQRTKVYDREVTAVLTLMGIPGTLLQRFQACGRHFGCRTGGIVLLNLLVKLARLIGLLGAVGFGQRQLCLRLTYRGSRVGGDLLVKLDGLVLAAGIAVLIG